jgi:hypothetical protein
MARPAPAARATLQGCQVGRPRCRRVDTLAAVGLCAEVGDLPWLNEQLSHISCQVVKTRTRRGCLTRLEGQLTVGSQVLSRVGARKSPPPSH